MRRRDALPELLCPAGDMECLVAAVAAGADAVYVGAKKFGARAYAKNFDLSEIDRASSYCHLHGVKLYVTLNTALTTSELSEALTLARELYSLGVDALIVADLGLIRELRRACPELELHASTQLSVHNSLGADVAYGLGCTRVVLARELSREDISAVVASSRAECEVFLHGALCVSHSGQCLFSSLVGGRSGNRGECAQPCRLNYNGDKYPLSLKDLCLAEHIPELIELGVASLKIEGRMKSPDYVYTVASVYRRLLDEHRRPTHAELDLLARAFSRSGFTDGYFTGRTERGMSGIRRADDISATRNMERMSFTPRRVAVRAEARIVAGEPSSLTLTLGELSVTAYGEIPEPARSAPLDGADVCSRLCKMGNTFLSLAADDISLELGEGLNISPSALNALRRSAVAMLECRGRDTRYSSKPPYVLSTLGRTEQTGVGTSALFLDPTVLSKLAREELTGVDVSIVPLFSEYPPLANGVYIPPVVMEHELREVRERLAYARECGIRYALVGNIGHIPLVREAGLSPIGDFRLNVCNSYARAALCELGIDDVMLSAELGEGAVRSIGGRAVVYGRIPLMLTERCFGRELHGCERCGSVPLVDRRGESFPVLREWKHRCLVLNSRVTYMADRLDKLTSRGSVAEHMIFSTESAGEAARILRAYASGEPARNGEYRRMGRRDHD